MASVDMVESNEMVEDSVVSCIPGNSQFCVGLKRSIEELKVPLLERDVSVVAVHCIGGGGKTTLARALCNDPQIKGYFKNVIFINVSQSPDLKGILETMWVKILKRNKAKFQNIEDGHIQLQQQLLMQSEPTLMILDDVWSKEDLDELLFEGTRYKTLITSRDSSIIPKTFSTEVYQLPLLGEQDALSLLCFWSFGHTSIPSTIEVNLVKKVQEECGGLPLALKVIGSSLNGQTHVAWERAKNKISNGKIISSYHEEGILKCLKSSIDSLDDVAKECFLDLGLFPKGKKICVEALLQIWVNFRKMEWKDAVDILFKLAGRNLINLSSNQR
ncbi:probable disease resistance protein At4g33300 [Cryptomeria japonica]|uniref:probable disease resistance protein At4g33300 n=1 Tax=Cryptomeria japonica TaxID=3369 RepID=UPI0025AD21DB|nr:probable disease resistance protein At4g33300 [Cryptomeria japonica]